MAEDQKSLMVRRVEIKELERLVHGQDEVDIEIMLVRQDDPRKNKYLVTHGRLKKVYTETEGVKIQDPSYSDMGFESPISGKEQIKHLFLLVRTFERRKLDGINYYLRESKVDIYINKVNP